MRATHAKPTAHATSTHAETAWPGWPCRKGWLGPRRRSSAGPPDRYWRRRSCRPSAPGPLRRSNWSCQFAPRPLPLWPRLLNGLLLPKALLVPGLIPLPVVRLPNMPDELVDWAATLPGPPRSMASINTGKIRVHRMIGFLVISDCSGSVLAPLYLYRTRCRRSVASIGARRGGIDTFLGLVRPLVLNFHTAMQAVTHVKHPTMAVKLDDDLPFRADGLHRAFHVSNGKAFPGSQFPQFVRPCDPEARLAPPRQLR